MNKRTEKDRGGGGKWRRRYYCISNGNRRNATGLRDGRKEWRLEVK
jgi:hypothetical protein